MCIEFMLSLTLSPVTYHVINKQTKILSVLNHSHEYFMTEIFNSYHIL